MDNFLTMHAFLIFKFGGFLITWFNRCIHLSVYPFEHEKWHSSYYWITQWEALLTGVNFET